MQELEAWFAKCGSGVRHPGSKLDAGYSHLLVFALVKSPPTGFTCVQQQLLAKVIRTCS